MNFYLNFIKNSSHKLVIIYHYLS